MKSRVVITGMEVVTSIGSGVNQFWEAAQQGQCGISRITRYNSEPYTTQVAGEVKDFSMAHLPEFDKSKRYPLVAQYALFCAHQALMDARLTEDDFSHTATYLGTSLGGMPELENAYQSFYEESWKKIPALSVIRGMPNSVANHIAIAYGLGGQSMTISNACISSAEAVGMAYRMIANNQLKVALCGGAESLVWETIMAAWCKLRVMSTCNDNPDLASRPFDQQRDGMVMADGAGMFVLEELNHAKARGATIYGEIIGFGSSCDAFHVTAPSTAGQVRAIKAALDDARLSPYDIQYINAHGTGTQLNDVTETQTIKTVLGAHAYDVPVTGLKAMTGHSIGAAGIIQLIATTLSLKHDVVLPTIHLTNPDPDCDLDYVPGVKREKRIDLALSNHFAFGGANAALLLRKYIE